MPRIFISYRREDTSGYAGRLSDHLQQTFGSQNIFIDIDGIQPGDDFVEAIQRRLEDCDVVLAVIGRHWMGTAAPASSRLQDEADFVRIEIESALERKIRVIPILVQGASMPRREDLPASMHGLVRRQAIELSDARWTHDVERLTRVFPDAGKAPPASRDHVNSIGNGALVTDSILQESPEQPKVETTRAINVTHKSLVDVANGEWISESLRVSANSRHVAFLRKKSRLLGLVKEFVVVVNGKEGRPYEFIANRSLQLSNDGRCVAYMAQKDDKWMVVVNGKVGRPYDNVLDEPLQLSNDGRRVAYAAEKRGKWMVVIDGKEGRRYDAVSSPQLSSNGCRFAYGAQRARKWMVVIDGKEGRRYDAVSPPQFSNDGCRVAYGAKRARKWMVVVDDKVGRPYDDVLSLQLSNDGRRVAYGAQKADKWIVVVDGEESRPYDGVTMPQFSNDGHRVAYFAKRARKWMVVVDGEESRPYDGIADEPQFSNDGRRIVSVMRSGRRWLLVLDRQEIPLSGPLLRGSRVFLTPMSASLLVVEGSIVHRFTATFPSA